MKALSDQKKKCVQNVEIVIEAPLLGDLIGQNPANHKG